MQGEWETATGSGNEAASRRKGKEKWAEGTKNGRVKTEREAENMTKQQSPVRYDFGRRLGR